MRCSILPAILLWISAPLALSWEPVSLPTADATTPTWLRCRLQVPDRLVVPEKNNPRDLWRSSTMLVFSDLPHGAEISLNGQSILKIGEIALGQSQRFKVPKDILIAGAFNTLVIRLERGALTNPPMLIDYFNELKLGPAWELSKSPPEDSDLNATIDRPATAIYTPADFRLSATPLDATTEPIPGKRVSPSDSLAVMQTDDDLTIDQLLHEPQIAQPTHISFDARGRMWVSQYRQYPYPKGVRMLSRDQYYRSKYDRVPPAPPYHDQGADIISVHSDSDGDGKFDLHKQVLSGLNMANAAVRGWGGFWVMHTPYLLFYPDADGDDQADRPPEVRLAGFGLEDTHSVANGLTWGPDGWLYGGQGSTTTSRITRPGVDPPDFEGIYNEGCLIWRYHPKSREFEIFADGGGNIFGLSFDADGRLFTGHNGGDTRGWHHIQEGQFLKQGKNPGKFGPPPNPYSFGELPMMRSTNPVPRFSNMAAVVSGTAMPDRLKGKFLCVDPLHHYLVAAERHVDGSTFETTDTGLPLRSDDITFRPVFLCNAPDGSMVIADFCEEFIAHGQNYQGQIDPSSGRIYRLRGTGLPLERQYNLEVQSGDELVATLEHPNLWHRQTAARLLGQRADRNDLTKLVKAFRTPSPHPAVDALWAIHQMGELDESLALEGLNHPAAIVRTWAVRLTGDSGILPDAFLAKLISACADESNPELRCQILSTALRLPAEQAIALVEALSSNRDSGVADSADPFIPLMYWFALEAHCEDSADLVLRLFDEPEFWSREPIKEHILTRVIRRFAEAGSRRDFLNCARLLRLAPTPEFRSLLLAGFDQAFEGRVPPPFPGELNEHLGAGSLSMQIRQGQASAISRGIALIGDAEAALSVRIPVIRAFGTSPKPEALPQLLKLAIATPGFDPALQSVALRALQSYRDPDIGRKLATSYSELEAGLRPLALNTLASRAGWSIDLLRQEDIPKSDIDPDLVARMRLHGSAELAQLLEKHFAIPQRSDPIAEAEAIRTILAGEPGDPYSGEAIFTSRCASCHTLFFKGGKVGPDLTRYQRDDLSTMLVGIIDPDAEIREGYENVIAKTNDGRILSGFLADEDANTVVLRGFDGSDITLARGDVTTLEPAGRSLMPAGLLTGLDDQALRDLFAYLKLSQPISK
ncbi:MAG: DUF7133 domain-containing protein [Verrucomicrobiales bacterium]